MCAFMLLFFFELLLLLCAAAFSLMFRTLHGCCFFFLASFEPFLISILFGLFLWPAVSVPRNLVCRYVCRLHEQIPILYGIYVCFMCSVLRVLCVFLPAAAAFFFSLPFNCSYRNSIHIFI